MIRSPLTALAVAALTLLLGQSSHALSFATPSAGGFAPVLQLDGFAAPAPTREAPPQRRADAGEFAIEAPPALHVDAASEDDGFQRYFDRHYRVHPLSDADSPHPSRGD